MILYCKYETLLFVFTWFKASLDYVSSVRWVTGGRIQFIPAPGTKKSTNSRGSKFLIFDPDAIGALKTEYVERDELLKLDFY